jgi:hypothetical protein
VNETEYFLMFFQFKSLGMSPDFVITTIPLYDEVIRERRLKEEEEKRL